MLANAAAGGKRAAGSQTPSRYRQMYKGGIS